MGAVGLGRGIAAHSHVGIVEGVGDLAADPGVGGGGHAGGQLHPVHNRLHILHGAVNGGSFLRHHGEGLVALGNAGIQNGHQGARAVGAVEGHVVDLVGADHADAVGHGQIIAGLVLGHRVGPGFPNVLNAGQGLGLGDLAVGHGHGEAVEDHGVVIALGVGLVAADRLDLRPCRVVAVQQLLLQLGAGALHIGGNVALHPAGDGVLNKGLLLQHHDDLHQVVGTVQVAGLLKLFLVFFDFGPISAGKLDDIVRVLDAGGIGFRRGDPLLGGVGARRTYCPCAGDHH